MLCDMGGLEMDASNILFIHIIMKTSRQLPKKNQKKTQKPVCPFRPAGGALASSCCCQLLLLAAAAASCSC
jgi:hypothetical protein